MPGIFSLKNADEYKSIFGTPSGRIAIWIAALFAISKSQLSLLLLSVSVMTYIMKYCDIVNAETAEVIVGPCLGLAILVAVQEIAMAPRDRAVEKAQKRGRS